MKKIVLMPTKNDAWILEKTLPCILMWADLVIIADQNSTDRTIEICNRSSKVKVLKNNNQFHSTKVRQMLLDEARKIEGKNMIFSIDSDEVVTADILDSEFREKMEKYPIGTSFKMQWVQLWRSTKKYRDDNSIWSNNYKHFAFIDDGRSLYSYEYGVNDHNPRVPAVLVKNTIKMDFPKVLHFQFVNWDRMLAKQRFYRVQDFIQTPRKFKNALQINNMYFIAKSESNLKLSNVPDVWTRGYEDQGIDLQNIKDQGLFWYDIEVLKWFEQFKPESFALLDIWDVDWEKKRQQALREGLINYKIVIHSQQNKVIKFYHNHQRQLSSVAKPILKLYKKTF